MVQTGHALRLAHTTGKKRTRLKTQRRHGMSRKSQLHFGLLPQSRASRHMKALLKSVKSSRTLETPKPTLVRALLSHARRCTCTSSRISSPTVPFRSRLFRVGGLLASCVEHHWLAPPQSPFWHGCGGQGTAYVNVVACTMTGARDWSRVVGAVLRDVLGLCSRFPRPRASNRPTVSRSLCAWAVPLPFAGGATVSLSVPYSA